MSHEVETMAHANAVPWHGLGVPVSNDLRVEEVLDEAKLNWTVSVRPLLVLSHQEGDFVPIENKRAIVRNSAHKTLIIASLH